jgi:glucose/arabinose dehydrogenase
LLGKILRLDVDAGDPYGIPPDNPFADVGGLTEIWAYGLRNPWRFSFDRLNGDMYIADVGQNAFEEIDYSPAGHPGGANFGWDYREGAHPFEGSPPADLDLIDPVAEYDHSQGCSVTGGYVYRGQNLPSWHGVYLYGDFCSGRVWGLLRLPDGSWQNALLFETGTNITSFGQDEAGEVYLVDRQGSVYRLAQR